MVKTYEQQNREERTRQSKEESKEKIKKACLLAIIALLIGFIAYISAINAQTTADINNVFQLVVNNTNLAPTIEPSAPGTGERVTGVTYFANTSPIELLVFAHANTISGTATVEVNINGTVVANQSGRPLGGAEETHRSITVIVPKYSSYVVNFSNYHHYEWREYPILSGKNGTLSVNQTFTINGSGFVNKTGDTMTGMLNAAAGINASDIYVNNIYTNNSGQINFKPYHPGEFGYYARIDPTDGFRVISHQFPLDANIFSANGSVDVWSTHLDMHGNNIINNPDIQGLQKNDTYFDSNYTAQTFPNSTIITNSNNIAALQKNDSYFNGTVFPLSTNFRNDSINDTIIRNYTAHIKVGSTTWNAASATGNLAVTGIGFKPSAINFMGVVDSTSKMSFNGYTDGITDFSVYDKSPASAGTYGWNGAAITIFQSSTDHVQGYISGTGSLDNDGFTLHMIKTGNPTGTITIIYEAMR